MSVVYGTLSENMCKEGISLAYVRAIAAAAGCGISKPEPDVGIDLAISWEAKGDLWTAAQVDAQVKATHIDDWNDGFLNFDLKKKNYNDLRANTMVPRILIVMVVPRGREEWLVDLDDLSELRRYAFWVSLKGSPKKKNARKVRVKLPKDQRFTVESLCALLQRAGDGLSL